MSELADQIRSLIDGSAPPVTLEEINAARSALASDDPTEAKYRNRPPRSWRLVGVAALVVAVVAISTWVATTQGPTTHASNAVGRMSTPKWHLTADLSDSQFELASGNPNGGVSEVQCGGVSTCFLSTYYGIGGDTSLTGATYVSHDAGHSWEPTTLPSGVATSTAVSCVTSTWCAAGGGLLDPSTGDPDAGKEMRDPELLTTSDAGSTWSMHAVPIPPDVQQLPAYGSLPAETTYWPGIVDAVACTAPGVCNVLAHVLNNDNQSAGMIPETIMFLRTTDGGATWTSSTLPETSAESGFEEQVPNGNGASLACPTASTCIAVSALAGFNQSQGVVDAWRTSDNGKTWQEAQITAQIPGIHEVQAGISCPTAEDCWVPTGGDVLHSIDGGAAWSEISTPPSSVTGGLDWPSISCTTATACVLSGTGMVATTNAGKSWNAVELPAQVGGVPYVACEVQGSCIAYAQPAQGSGSSDSNGGSLILTNGPASANSGS